MVYGQLASQRGIDLGLMFYSPGCGLCSMSVRLHHRACANVESVVASVAQTAMAVPGGHHGGLVCAARGISSHRRNLPHFHSCTRVLALGTPIAQCACHHARPCPRAHGVAHQRAPRSDRSDPSRSGPIHARCDAASRVRRQCCALHGPHRSSSRCDLGTRPKQTLVGAALAC